MPDKADFQRVLDSMLREMDEKHKSEYIVTAGDVHRMAGGYPGPDHRMPLCAEVMKATMKPGDKIIVEPPGGAGATLAIRYKLPR